MIDAVAKAGAVLGESRYLEAAQRAADFVLQELRRDEGRLLHTWRHGVAKLDAYLDDYACLADGLISLYEATSTGRYLDEAVALIDIVLEKFPDEKAGGFYFTADDHEQLILRNKDLQDNAVPSGNAMAATALMRLSLVTGKQRYRDAAEQAIQATLALVQRYPSAAGQMLQAVDMLAGPSYEMVLVADAESAEGRQANSLLQQRYLPNKVLITTSADGPAAPQAVADLLAGKEMLGDSPTLYICEGFTCQAPAQGIEEIEHALDNLNP